jgi:hypothetical protein
VDELPETRFDAAARLGAAELVWDADGDGCRHAPKGAPDAKPRASTGCFGRGRHAMCRWVASHIAVVADARAVTGAAVDEGNQ